MTEQEKAVWIEIVNDCNSSQKSVNVGTRKRRSVINAVNKVLNLADISNNEVAVCDNCGSENVVPIVFKCDDCEWLTVEQTAR